MTKTPYKPSIVMLSAYAAISVLTLNMFLPALPKMAQDFGVSYSLVSLSISGYLAATAILQLILGPLSDKYGRQPTLLGILIIFTLASIGCFLTDDFYWFMVFRLLQSVVIGAWGITMAMVRDTRSQAQSASAMGYISMTMGIAPMLGPIIGGYISENMDWRIIFVAYAVLGIALTVLCMVALKETLDKETSEVDLHVRDYASLVTEKTFWGYSLGIAFATGSFYVFLAMTPIIASAYQLSLSDIGLYMGSITAGFMFGSFFSGRLATNYSQVHLFLVGRLSPMVGLGLGLLVIPTMGLGFEYVFLATLLVGIGNGVSLPNINALALSVNRKLTGSSAGLVGSTTVAVGALLTVVASFVAEQEPTALALMLVMLVCVLLSVLAPMIFSGLKWK